MTEADPSEEQDDELFEHHRIVADLKQGLVRIDKFLMARLPNVTQNKNSSGNSRGLCESE